MVPAKPAAVVTNDKKLSFNVLGFWAHNIDNKSAYIVDDIKPVPINHADIIGAREKDREEECQLMAYVSGFCKDAVH
jgi:hypothetical protein